jgi:hypothetical protein
MLPGVEFVMKLEPVTKSSAALCPPLETNCHTRPNRQRFNSCGGAVAHFSWPDDV